MTTLHRCQIRGTGAYLPEKLLSNHDLAQMVDTSHEWILKRTGIEYRHVAAEDQVTSDLAFEAASRALEAADMSASELDLILFATSTPDQPMPNTASVLQQKLGAGHCAALDFSAACAGSVYGMGIARDMIATGSHKNVLLVGADTLTRIMDYSDRGTCILFGDGAGAVVLSRADEDNESQIYSHHLHADGDLGDMIELHAGGSAHPFSQAMLDDDLHYVKMKGRPLFKHAVRTMSRACTEALEHNNMSPDEVDWVIPHQANIRIIEAVAAHFGIEMERVVVEIRDMGNISAATIFVSMDRAIRDGRIQRGHNLLLTGFGAGVTSGGVLMKY